MGMLGKNTAVRILVLSLVFTVIPIAFVHGSDNRQKSRLSNVANYFESKNVRKAAMKTAEQRREIRRRTQREGLAVNLALKSQIDQQAQNIPFKAEISGRRRRRSRGGSRSRSRNRQLGLRVRLKLGVEL